MDGVLFDSMKNHAEAWYRVMGEHYGFTCDRDVFYLYEGSTGQQTIDAFFVQQRGRHATEDEISTIYAEKSQVFTSLGLAMPMPGAADVLRKVGERGLKRILVTGSGQPSLIGRLQDAYPGVFTPETIVWGKECPIGHGKPHPDPYLLGLRKAAGILEPLDWQKADPSEGFGGLLPSEAIVVENAPMGVEAAHAAGIYTVAVNTGPLDKSVLLDSGADIVFDSMIDLAANFDSLVAAIIDR